jgi:hypothetical protein
MKPEEVLKAMIQHSVGYVKKIFVSDESPEAYYRRTQGKHAPENSQFEGEFSMRSELPTEFSILPQDLHFPLVIFQHKEENNYHTISSSVSFLETYTGSLKFSHSIADLLKHARYKLEETKKALSPYNPGEAGKLVIDLLSGFLDE